MDLCTKEDGGAGLLSDLFSGNKRLKQITPSPLRSLRTDQERHAYGRFMEIFSVDKSVRTLLRFHGSSRLQMTGDLIGLQCRSVFSVKDHLDP